MLAGECLLYRSIHAHYSAAVSLQHKLGSGDRSADRTQGQTRENTNDRERERERRVRKKSVQGQSRGQLC